jgi:hypothetical protein
LSCYLFDYWIKTICMFPSKRLVLTIWSRGFRYWLTIYINTFVDNSYDLVNANTYTLGDIRRSWINAKFLKGHRGSTSTSTINAFHQDSCEFDKQPYRGLLDTTLYIYGPCCREIWLLRVNKASYLPTTRAINCLLYRNYTYNNKAFF